MQDSWHKYAAEAFATFGVVFLAAGAALAHGLNGGLGLIGIALASGLGLTAMFYAAHHLSGAHLNPAVTISLWATGRLRTNTAVGYVLAQLLGAVVAALFLRLVFADASPAFNLGNVGVAANVTPGTAILVEALLSFLLVYTYFATVVHKKGDGAQGGLALGAVWAGSILLAWSLTGGALNPARVFGSSLIANDWTMHYVYWVGPLLGGLVAAFVYHFGYMKR
jgi:MIP family channel proteins